MHTMLFFKDPAESDLKQNRFAIRVRGTESETTATDHYRTPDHLHLVGRSFLWPGPNRSQVHVTCDTRTVARRQTFAKKKNKERDCRSMNTCDLCLHSQMTPHQSP